MISIGGYGLVTSAGASVPSLWRRMFEPRNPSDVDADVAPGPVRARLLERLSVAYQECIREEPIRRRYGVLLASTKGFSNDFIWDASGDLSGDPLTPLLMDFLRAHSLEPERALCVSNACSSALGALAMARIWMEQGLDQVLILAADAVTPFVTQGFQSLKLMSATVARPFDRRRDGFRLGEAACAILLSQKVRPLRLAALGLDTEGSVVTRPATSSLSLARAAKVLVRAPDAILAHGTATLINDETEELAFQKIFGSSTPPITGSKWRVGHTLGASAAIDVILACEVLRQQRLFALATTSEVADGFKSQYVTGSAREGEFRSVMISSLGFGGMHAVAQVELVR